MRKEGRGLRYMKGCVALLMTGKEPERFLNLCAANRIDLWDLIHTEDGYRMKVSVRIISAGSALPENTFPCQDT